MSIHVLSAATHLKMQQQRVLSASENCSVALQAATLLLLLFWPIAGTFLRCLNFVWLSDGCLQKPPNHSIQYRFSQNFWTFVHQLLLSLIPNISRMAICQWSTFCTAIHFIIFAYKRDNNNSSFVVLPHCELVVVKHTTLVNM